MNKSGPEFRNELKEWPQDDVGMSLAGCILTAFCSIAPDDAQRAQLNREYTEARKSGEGLEWATQLLKQAVEHGSFPWCPR